MKTDAIKFSAQRLDETVDVKQFCPRLDFAGYIICMILCCLAYDMYFSGAPVGVRAQASFLTKGAQLSVDNDIMK
jgi:hypothetical protein